MRFEKGNPGYGLRKKQPALPPIPKPRTSTEAIAMLETLFPRAVETLGDGLTKNAVTRNQLLSAQIILDRFVPRLKHTELSGDPENPLFHLTQIDLARAILRAGDEAKQIAAPESAEE